MLFSLYPSLLWELRDKRNLKKFAILTRKPRSHASILIYRMWPIEYIVCFWTYRNMSGNLGELGMLWEHKLCRCVFSVFSQNFHKYSWLYRCFLVTCNHKLHLSSKAKSSYTPISMKNCEGLFGRESFQREVLPVAIHPRKWIIKLVIELIPLILQAFPGNCEAELPKKPVGRLSVSCQLTDRLPTVYPQSTDS